MTNIYTKRLIFYYFEKHYLFMIRPKYLKKGDTIAIVSTARKVTKNELNASVLLLTKWGLKVIYGTSIGAKHNQFAGDDSLRATDFQLMIDNIEVKAIWCARGGYGTVRIIDKLNFNKFKKTPKWIIGYSDITVLHAHIHKLGIETLHAQMPVAIETKSESSIQSLKNALFGENIIIKFPSQKINIIGKEKGILVGGNLSILYSLCGSPSALTTEEKILFIEDLDEYLYHIDRMLQNLKRNGVFKKLRGLIVGGMTKMHDNTIPYGKTVEEIILDTCGDYNFPIAFNFPAGHIKNNTALYLGRDIEFIVDNDKVSVTYLN